MPLTSIIFHQWRDSGARDIVKTKFPFVSLFYAHPLSDICTWWPPIADVELYSSGGLSVVAWLEGPTGRIEANPSESGPTKNPTFPVTMGTSYELISAVFGNGKMLVRLPNFSFHPPQELKARHKKKYGLNVPLVAFTQTEGRPLSLNFDIGR